MIELKDGQFLKLILRSPDRGEGWRSVSEQLWPLVLNFGVPELIELDHEEKRVRLSEQGRTIAQYAL